MEHYIPITRKYRPKTFSEVLGQNSVVEVLKNSLIKGRVGYAYLFSGIRGTGKTTLARIFAKALNCQNRGVDGEPCNECASCKEIMSGSSLDVIEIDGASNRGIDDVRQITESAAYAPSQGKFKIYIIDEVHMLTKEAFNALLKTLEEPPATVKFFFATTEPQKVPTTILSRCQRFPLKSLSGEEIGKKLSGICDAYGVPAEKDALESLAKLAQGSVRDAESLLEKMLLFTDTQLTKQNIEEVLGLPTDEDFISFDAAAKEHNLNFAFTLVEKLKEEGKEPKAFLVGLSEHLRLHLRASLTGKQVALSKDFLIQGLDLLVNALSSQTISFIHLEVILLKLLRMQKRLHPELLVERLEKLEKELSQPASGVATPKPIVETISTPKVAAPPSPKIEPLKPVTETPAAPKIEPPKPIVEAPPTTKTETPKPIAEPTAAPKADPPKPIVETASTQKVEASPAPKAAASPTVKIETPKPVAEIPTAPKVETPQKEAANYDTLLRFAGVELNGSVNK